MGRIGGFLRMWIGMAEVTGPPEELADFIPLPRSASRGIVLFATFPIALTFTPVTALLSVLLHSAVARVVIGVLLLGWAARVLKRKAAKAP